MKYVVKRYWELFDSVEVEADSEAQAIARAHEMPTDNGRAHFVPDSMNTDPDSEVWLVGEAPYCGVSERRP